MGKRGYIVVKINEKLNDDELWDITKKYESINGVEFSDNVVGNYDFVLTIDTEKRIEEVLDEIKNIAKIDQAISLTTNNIFKKHREMKDLKILDDIS